MTDSKMTDDMDLKERYNESLAAIEGSRKADQANAVLRRELKEYISQMDDAMDRAGIEVPENFEEIVKIMDRKDLTGEATETSNWSKHLLTEKFDQKLESEFDGRYNDVFTDTSEVKHQRGLAQIYLLDRQLQEISRKAKHPAVLVDDQSASSQIEDKTFITAKDTIDNEAESRQASLPVEPTSEEKEEPIEELKEEEIDRFNFLLSVDDENFIKRDELLQMYKQVEMECTEIDRNLDQYGRLDRMATDTEPATQNGSSKKNKTSSARSKIDYLTEQRIERAEKEKVDELEKYLKLCTYNDPSAMDYSGLFDCEPQATQNNCRRNASSSPVGEEESDWRTDDYETELRNTKKSKKKAPSSPAKEDMSLDLVPQYGKVLVKRSSNESGISYAFHKEQIVRLIENAKDGAELSLKEHSSSSDGDSDSAVYSTAAADDIKALLSQYQDHITTLSCLRKQQISSSSSYSPKIPPQLRPPLSSSSSSLPPSSYDPSDPFDCLFFNAMDQSLPLSPTNHTNATINPTNQLNPANPPGLFPPIPSAETRPSPPTAQVRVKSGSGSSIGGVCSDDGSNNGSSNGCGIEYQSQTIMLIPRFLSPRKRRISISQFFTSYSLLTLLSRTNRIFKTFGAAGCLSCCCETSPTNSTKVTMTTLMETTPCYRPCHPQGRIHLHHPRSCSSVC